MQNINIAEYKKSLEDELDWNLLDQIHKVVLQTSTFCFRTKQICLTVDAAVVVILIKLTSNKLDESIFVAGLLVPLGFWFLDAIGYFYQVKLRGVMDKIRNRLIKRNSKEIVLTLQSEVIKKERVDIRQISKIWGSFFNHSMWIYVILIFLDITLWFLFIHGVIS